MHAGTSCSACQKVATESEHDSVNKGGHGQEHRAAISNQQSSAEQRNAESRIAIIRFQFEATEMHEIAITRPQFEQTEMHEVHTNHTRTAHNRISTANTSTTATTQPIFRTCEGQAHDLV